jgi:hypothetical protein
VVTVPDVAGEVLGEALAVVEVFVLVDGVAPEEGVLVLPDAFGLLDVLGLGDG